jgi:hypothetical protein
VWNHPSILSLARPQKTAPFAWAIFLVSNVRAWLIMWRMLSWTVLLLALASSACAAGQTGCISPLLRRSSFPAVLGDVEFWNLSTSLSEPAGEFAHSENLVSNERYYAQIIRLLRPTGGAYIGVGPEQNYSYMARLRPAMAFIIDIRRENQNLHFMYKALFELSGDRADFVSRLFSRERPTGLDSATSVHNIFAAYATVSRSHRLFEETVQLMRNRLLETHRFPLLPADLDWIEYAFKAFYDNGPELHYSGSRSTNAPEPSYRDLMTAQDLNRQFRSFLSTEEAFAFVRELHARNLIVPVVGDFAGPRSIQSVGDYVRHHGGTLAAFYGSNVEVYLNRRQLAMFCANLATLPYDWQTWFVVNNGMRPLRLKLKTCGSGGIR